MKKVSIKNHQELIYELRSFVKHRYNVLRNYSFSNDIKKLTHCEYFNDLCSIYNSTPDIIVDNVAENEWRLRELIPHPYSRYYKGSIQRVAAIVDFCQQKRNAGGFHKDFSAGDSKPLNVLRFRQGLLF